MKRLSLTLMCAVLAGAGIARANTIDIAFDFPGLTGTPGSILEFTVNLTNTTLDDVFLNGDNVTLAGFPLSAIDDSPFFNNTPTGVLSANSATGSIAILDITIPDSVAQGLYDGTFEILGGGTPDDQTIIGSSEFHAQVTPEPATWQMLFAASAVGWLLARRRIPLHHDSGNDKRGDRFPRHPCFRADRRRRGTAGRRAG